MQRHINYSNSMGVQLCTYTIYLIFSMYIVNNILNISYPYNLLRRSFSGGMYCNAAKYVRLSQSHVPFAENGLFRITVLYMLSVDVDKAFVSE